MLFLYLINYKMTQLYPIKFNTIYKDKIWGGQKINTYLHKNFGDLPNCGETWELSGVKGNVSTAANGELTGKSLTELIETYRAELVGKSVYERFGNDFPLLIKFIDANEDLSIQVHPDDELAQKRHQSFGKTEMWYVLQADPGATLISGFSQNVDESIYLNKLNSGKINDILNKESVKAGDVFFLPAGRVHTIGKGLLIAEIQQTSDITYRIYDFDRVDDKGEKRELHTEEALAAIDYNFYPSYKSSYADTPNQANKVVECDYFSTNLIVLNDRIERNYTAIDSFKILICVDGSCTIQVDQHITEITLGECVLIPANINTLALYAKNAKLLETYVP